MRCADQESTYGAAVSVLPKIRDWTVFDQRPGEALLIE
jgi:hypothetical protein